VVAREGAHQQAGELVADCLSEAEQSCRLTVLNAVEAGTMLEDESETAG
jgi:hypothetical protein